MKNGFCYRRLIKPLLELLKQGVTPEKLALILPFFRLGEKLFHAPHLPISVAQIYSVTRANLWDATKFLWSTTWHAIIAWAIIAPFLALFLYSILVPLFHRFLQKQNASLHSAEVKAA
jgi:hypothetical protein